MHGRGGGAARDRPGGTERLETEDHEGRGSDSLEGIPSDNELVEEADPEGPPKAKEPDDRGARPAKEWVPIVEWEYAQQKIPWTILFLFSGGFALNQGFSDSLLNVWLGDSLKGLADMPLYALVLIVCVATSALSNIASNTASANILMPIVALLAQNSRTVHPWMLMIPCAFSTSCCFIMPVATPPNLVCYGSGRLRMRDFMIAGSFINVVAVFIASGMAYTLIPVVLDAHGFPDWALPEALANASAIARR